MAKKDREVPIRTLNNGRCFKFSDEVLYKDCYLVRSTECSATIGGLYRNDKKSDWKVIPNGYAISNGTLVIPLDKVKEIKVKKNEKSNKLVD